MTVKQYDIVLNYDSSKADASLGAFRNNVIRQFNELNANTAKIELFKDLEKDSKAANAQVVKLRDESERLNAILAKLGKGDTGFKQLAAEVKSVDKELRAAEKSAGSYSDKIRLLDGELRAAGVDTKNLAAEQIALARAIETAKRAVATQSARQTLGVTGADEASAQIAKLTAAYSVLHAAEKAGTITSNELAVAKRNLSVEIAKVNSSLAGTSGATTSITTAFIALAAGAYAVGRGFTALTDAAKTYEQGIARVSSITTQNKVQLAEMGAEVLKLTARIGIDLPTAFDALYNIISSGIPTENALTVLEQSAKAAIAGVTDVATASRIGVAVLNAYQLQVSELPRVFDILFQTVKDGVVTFPELAAQLGEILPVARSAGVGLEEVNAAMIVLTRNGLGAAEASTGIQRAIQAISSPTPEAVASLLSLGVAYNGLEGTLQQLADKNLGADVLRNIIPDVRGQRAVTILTKQYELFREELEATTKSAGAAKSAFDKLADTPEQQVKKLTAAFVGLTTAAGESLLPIFLLLIAKATDLIKTFGELDAKYGAFIRLTTGGSPGLSQLAGEFEATVAIAKRFGPELERAGIASDKATFALEGLRIGGKNTGDALVVVGGNVGELGRKFLELDKSASRSAAEAVKAAAVFSEAFAPTATLVGKSLAIVDSSIVGIEAKLKFLAERLGAVSGASKTLFDQANVLTEQGLQKTITAIELSLAKREITEIAAIKAIEDVRQTSYITQLANLKTFSAQAIAAFDKEAQDRRALAAKNGKDLIAFDIETRDARIKLIGELQAKYASYILDISNQEKKFTEEIKTQQDARRALVEGNEIDIRAIYRTTLNSYYQRVDIARQTEETISRLRQAVAQGDLTLAKKYADESKALIKESLGTLTEEEKASATGIIARSEAQQGLNKVTGILSGLLDGNIKSLQGVAAGYGALKVEAVGAAVDIGEKLSALRADQAEAIPLRVKEDSAQIDAEINNLQTKLAQREGLIAVKLLTDGALAAAQKLIGDIEKNKPQLEIDADFTKLKEKTAAALKALPSVDLSADDTKVLASFKGIETGIVDLGKKRIELQSNADEVAAKLAEINGLSLDKKQLTIEVNYTYPNGKPALGTQGTTADANLPGLARGGLVGASTHSAMRSAAIAKFASGGSVGKVPGSGNTDSVYAQLLSGSFVLRKSASQIVEDIQAHGSFVDPNNKYTRPRGINRVAGSLTDPNNFLTRLRGATPDAVGVAGGLGGVDAAAVNSGIDAYTAQLDKRGPFDRAGLIGGMLDSSVDEMRRNIAELRRNTPGGFVEAGAEELSARLAQPKISAVKTAYSNAVGQRQEGAANAATKTAIELAQDLVKPLSNIDFSKFKGQGDGGNFLADGGSIKGSPVVPAMVMPGELIFDPAAVRAIGVKNLMAMNVATSAQQMRDRMRFGSGGAVGMPPSISSGLPDHAHALYDRLERFNLGGVVSSSNATDNSTHINIPSITLNTGSSVNERQLSRALFDQIGEIARKRK